MDLFAVPWVLTVTVVDKVLQDLSVVQVGVVQVELVVVLVRF